MKENGCFPAGLRVESFEHAAKERPEVPLDDPLNILDLLNPVLQPMQLGNNPVPLLDQMMLDSLRDGKSALLEAVCDPVDTVQRVVVGACADALPAGGLFADLAEVGHCRVVVRAEDLFLDQRD
jgi:hypothetical protein